MKQQHSRQGEAQAYCRSTPLGIRQGLEEKSAAKEGQGNRRAVVDEAPREAVAVREGNRQQGRPTGPTEAAQQERERERQTHHVGGQKKLVCDGQRKEPVQRADQVVVPQVRSELTSYRKELRIEGGGIVEAVEDRNQVQMLRQIHHGQVPPHPERDGCEHQAKGVGCPPSYVHSNIRCRGLSAAF